MSLEATLQVDLERKGEIGVARLAGRLVAENRFDFKTRLRPWEDSGQPAKIIIHLAGLEYMDSAGLAALIGSWKKLNETGGVLVVAEVNPQLKTLFQVAAIEKFFKIFPSLAEAETYLAGISLPKA